MKISGITQKSLNYHNFYRSKFFSLLIKLLLKLLMKTNSIFFDFMLVNSLIRLTYFFFGDAFRVQLYTLSSHFCTHSGRVSGTIIHIFKSCFLTKKLLLKWLDNGFICTQNASPNINMDCR